jgi:DNA-binding IclR family transcriptional regulator
MASSTPMNGILRMLGEGGIHSTAELARRLGVSEGLVAAMTDDLGQRGYLAAVNASCETACMGCGVRTTCALPEAPRATLRLFALTAKGRRASQKAL